jgi:hypothetical protein
MFPFILPDPFASRKLSGYPLYFVHTPFPVSPGGKASCSIAPLLDFTIFSVYSKKKKDDCPFPLGGRLGKGVNSAWKDGKGFSITG